MINKAKVIKSAISAVLSAVMMLSIFGGTVYANTFTAGESNTFTVSSSDITDPVNETEQYYLTVSKGTNMQSVTGEGWYDKGTTVTANGVPTATYTDSGTTYTVDPNNSGHRYFAKHTFTVNPVEKIINSSQSATVDATETKTNAGGDQYKLTVNKGTGVASVTLNPASSTGWYDKGTKVTVGSATYNTNFVPDTGVGTTYTMNSKQTANVTALEAGFYKDGETTIYIHPRYQDGYNICNWDFIMSHGQLSNTDGLLSYIGTSSGSGFPRPIAKAVSTTGKLVIPSSVKILQYNVFIGDTALKTVVIPASVTQIKDQAFMECSNLESVIFLPDSQLNEIGQDGREMGTFYKCTSLKSISLPDSVTILHPSTFGGCTSLTSVRLPKNLTSLEHYLFGQCTSLTSITIPDNVTNISSNVFATCTSLTSITIPKKVTKLSYGIFNGCKNLTTINFAGTKAQWNAITKDSNWKGNAPATVVHCSNGDVSL